MPLVNIGTLGEEGVLFQVPNYEFDYFVLQVVDDGNGSTITVETSTNDTTWSPASGGYDITLPDPVLLTSNTVNRKGRYQFRAPGKYVRVSVSSYVSGRVRVLYSLTEDPVVVPQVYKANILSRIKGDDSADDTVAIKALAEFCRVNNETFSLPKPRFRYRLTDTVDLRYLAVDAHHAIFRLTHDKIGFILGGNSLSGYNPAQSLGWIIRPANQPKTSPCARAIGVKGQTIRIHNLYWLEVWADYTINTDGSSAYSNFYVDAVAKLHLNTPATGGGWINENQFWVNRITEEIYINGNDFRHNHNKFYNCNLEGPVTVNIVKGADTKLYGARFEAGPTTIMFGAESERNVIIHTWTQSAGGGPANLFDSGSITDLGIGNKVIHENAAYNSMSVVASGDITDVVLNTRDLTLTPMRRAPTLQRITTLGSNVPAVMSDMLPAVAEDYFIGLWEGADPGDVVRYRAQIEFFDKNLQPLAANTNFVVQPGTWNAVGNAVRPSNGNESGIFFRVTKEAVDAGAAFVRVSALGSSGQLPNALARRISILHCATNRIEKAVAITRGREGWQAPYLVTGIPTQGFAPLGFDCLKSDGTAIYRCIKSLERSLTAVSDTGSTTITVSDITGISSGDRIGINLDNRDTYWSTVSTAPSGSTITLTGGLPSAAASGSRVVIVRWATIAQTLT